MSPPMRSPVTLAELTAGLIWPRLLRALSLSMAPSRLAIGFLLAASTAAIGSLFDSVRGSPLAVSTIETVGVFEALSSAVAVGVTEGALGAVSLDGGRIAAAVAYAVERIGATAWGAPLSLAALLLLILPIYVICGVAICRSIACDVAWRIGLGPVAALRFGVGRVRSGLGALVIPIVLIALVALLLMASGWLMQWPVLDVLGGALYALLLVGALVLVIAVAGVVFAQALLLPAIAADGADSIDAVQRAYAYVLGRPGRLVLYTAVLLAIGSIGLVVLSLGVAWTINLAADLAGAWRSDPTLGGAVEPFAWTRAGLAEPAEGTRAVALWLVRFWEGMLALLLAGWAFSYFFTSGSLLYLLLRRVNDDQDIEEIWLGPDASPGAAPAANS